MKALKVYGRTGWRGAGQTREVVAARSAAEAQRLFGCRPSEWRHSGCETGNAEELAVALARPGVVFYLGLNEAMVRPELRERDWIAVEPTR